ncbi:MAG: isoleucine--tRNA ligase [Sodaliphilus sp.]|nr:isoleucine--tRNA ligase [Bacteroidales bacterium]MDY3135298.1 isoleucine--tRNA ligase [Sodaliphilus sp.]HAO63719.1 isoleucine--tRNA ligase [Porphyromonadaceae bacterium]MCI6656181.1 isoleucine--tRNA ligase [Bacteroidales bacterium]MCI6903768.1 isoleucine--tRNA ligase [Bacteroidales bacterium]
MKFREYSKLNLSDVNKDVLKLWEQENVFAKSIDERDGAPTFVFYEGPPSANGMPGIHHVLARTIKDIVCRYKTMNGFKVLRKAGWDTHGLPVELGVEKSLGIKKEDIGKKISVDEYNAACRKEVMKYTKEWTDLTNKMGYWVDLEHPYITYKNSYIESLWWLLKQLYGKNLLYKGYTIQPYSPAAGTGLSSHELNQPGCYRDVKDQTVTAQFAVKKDDNKIVADILSKVDAGFEDLCIIAWTTTPWTLPSNTALCVGPKIDYVAVESYNPYTGKPATYILAKARLNAYFAAEGAELALDSYKQGDKVIPYKVIAEFTGADLVGMKYEQLFPWVKPVDKIDGKIVGNDNGFRVIPGDYVTTDDGTGIVHIAPTFGADDANVARAAGIPSLFMINKKMETRPMVDFEGRYFNFEDLDDDFVKQFVNVDLYKEYAGAYVKNAYDPKYTVDGRYDEKAANKAEDLNIYICIRMKQDGTAFKMEKHTHNYPHCWRTDKPILYYPLDSWFIRSTACRDRMVELNKSIKWKPEHTGTGRFGKWLENLNDWNLSRSRYWGTPLPIWRNADTHEEICIGSVEELYNEMEKAVAAGVMAENPWKKAGFVVGDYSDENYNKIDLHRPYVDDIVLVSESGKPMKRELDLIDVWFDSGAMPYAQLHYPFENKDLIDNRSFYPADFIAEGQDQTRGWFFTLHAIATMVFDSVAYKSVISNGLVLDKNGNKMSKRLGNAVDPFMAIEKYGTDPIRWYMISNSSPWDNLKFDEAGVEEVSGSKFFGKLHNTYSFFALYANLCNFDFAAPQVPLAERPEIDRWIISVLNSLVKEVTDDIEDYELTKAARAISDFVVNNLSNWYVRLNRSRFWDGDLAANQTLYQSLKTVAMLMAPIAPFYADMLYRDLTGSDTSVHLAAYPKADEAAIDSKLEKRMAIAQQITSMVLSLRRKKNLKVKQPLTAIMIPVLDEAQKQDIEAVADLIMSEVNVKGINYVGGDAGILVKRIKPDFKKLGPKFGKNMKAAAQALTSLEQSQIAQFEKDGKIALTLNGEEAVVELADVEVISEDIPGWLVANDGNITVALDITITDDLRKEGIARELVNRIQNVRKSKDFNITDRIVVKITPDEHVNDAVAQFKDYIAKQVLAVAIELAPVEGADVIALDMDDYELKITVDKA